MSSAPSGKLTRYLNGIYLFYPDCHGSLPPLLSKSLNVVTHVFYAFANVHEDATVDLDFGDGNIEGCLVKLQRLKKTKRKDLKFLLSIGGGGDGSVHFASAASSPEGRTTFVSTTKMLVDKYGFDGVDVDWEHPSTAAEGIDFVTLLADLRNAMPGPQYQIVCALGAGPWALTGIDLAQVSQIVDFINVMCYDFLGPWSSNAGYHSQLFDPTFPNDPSRGLSCQTAIHYYLSQNVAPRKLVLGYPAYGRSFLGAVKPGDVFIGTGGAGGAFKYSELPRPGTVENVDNIAGAAYCVGGDGGFVSYDNEETVRAKAAFVKDNALLGLFGWHASADATGRRNLALAAHDGLMEAVLTGNKNI